MLQYQQLKIFSTRSFDTLENVGMTSAGAGKFSAVSNAQSNETPVEKHSLQRCLSPTHADQEHTSVSRISELKVTGEPEAQFLEHDLEIPPEAKITSVPLSSFTPKMQQVMLARAKNVSEIRQATEMPTVTYIWPVIKVEQASVSFWDYFRKISIAASPNLTRHNSSPDSVAEDVKCSQLTSVKQLGQEEPDRKTARSYPLILKSSNSVVSRILKSLANFNNKDYKNLLPPSSTSPVGKQPEIPLYQGNALVIYDGQVYILYVMTYEDLPPEMEIHGCGMLLRQTTVWLIVCRGVSEARIEVAHSLQSRGYVVKRNINPLKTLASPARQDKASKAARLSSHGMMTISQSKQRFYSTRKRQQFLSKTAFPSKEGLQKRSGREAHWVKDSELRKQFGIVKDVRVHLNRICVPALVEKLRKYSSPRWKVAIRKKKRKKVRRYARAICLKV